MEIAECYQWAADVNEQFTLVNSRLLSIEDRLAALKSKNCVEDTNSKKRRQVHSPKIALPVRYYETVRKSFRYKHPDLASQAEAGKKEEARQSVLAEDEVGLWKCATIELMSDEEDGIVGGVSGWIVRPLATYSSEAENRHHGAVGFWASRWPPLKDRINKSKNDPRVVENTITGLERKHSER
ncbi:hypothetical protein DPX16_23463 [Anabarilius grahami]|uniref:Uncharacterized protein n=1 Tax=Anabarilius grahami TaxID=495550 RepID=A0A3N0XCS9_ANAGA|nr:hypothetical protein DPX16_23463 [Anabarilius grahami]